MELEQGVIPEEQPITAVDAGEEVVGWQDVPDEPAVDLWNYEQAPTPPLPDVQLKDPTGTSAMVAKATGSDAAKVKGILESPSGEAAMQEAASIVLRNKQKDMVAQAENAMSAGDVGQLEALVGKIQDVNKSITGELSAAASYKHVAEAAVTKLMDEDPRTKLNLDGYTREQIIQKHSADTLGQAWYKDAGKIAEFLGKGILAETVYRIPLINSFRSAFGLQETSSAMHYFNTNTLKDDMAKAMSGLDKEELNNRLEQAVRFARENGADDVSIASFLVGILDDTTFDLWLANVGDVAGPVTDLLAGVGLVAKVGKAAKATKIIADAGGSKALGGMVGDDALNGSVLFTPSEAAAMAQKLSPENVLPDGVFGASSAVQDRLVADTQKLLSDLTDRLASQNVYSKELDTAVKELAATFDPNINRGVRAFEVGRVGEGGIENVVTWANKDGTSFATKEAAEAFAQRQKMTSFEVVQDTSSAGFAVKQSVLDAYKKELADLRARIDVSPTFSKTGKLTVFHGSTSASPLKALDEAFIGTGEGKATEGYGFYFTDSESLGKAHTQVGSAGGTLHATEIDPKKMFSWNGYISEASKSVQAGVLKAIKEISPDDYAYYKANGLDITGKELYRDILQGNTNGKRASDTLAKYGVEGHTIDNMGDSFNYDAIARGVEGQYKSYVVYPGGKQLPVRPVGDSPVPKMAGDDAWTVDSWNKAIADIENTKHTYDNVWEGKAQGVLKNMSPSIKVSNDIGKKMSEAIVAWHKMLGFTGRKVVVVTYDEAKKLAKKFTDMDIAQTAVKGNHAVHYVKDGVNYIVMNTPANTNDGLYTLAHEFGHMFDTAFKQKYDKQIQDAWVKWKRTNLPKGKWENIQTPEELTKAGLFRVPTQQDMGNATSFKTLDPGYAQWAAMREEWFAEQFSKWMVGDMIPRSQFEHLLKALYNQLTSFVQDVVERLGVPAAKADKAVAKFLNEHVASVAKAEGAKKKAAKELADTVARADELEASIAAAEEAMKLPYHGWLVKEKRVDDIKYNAIKGFDEADIESSFWIGIDPKHLVSEFLVEGRVIGIHGEAKVMKSLSEFMIGAVQPLNKQELQRVYGTLKKGDSYSEGGGLGKEFNAVELKSMGLSDKEMESYFKLRTARNVMFELKDEEYAKAMRKQGFKQIGIDFGDGKSFVSAGKLTTPRIGQSVYDVRTKTAIAVDQAFLDELAVSGGKVVKMEEIYVPNEGGKSFKTFVVDDDNSVISDVRSVLHKRPGEFSRIYTDEYFITLSKMQDVDGAAERLTDTIHTATIKADAEKFVAAMNMLAKTDKEALTLEMVEDAVGQWASADGVLRNFQEGLYEGAEFAQHYNRIKEEYVTNFTRGLEGSLFTGRRGQRLTSISEDKDNVMDIFGSLQAEITNTARVMGRTDWRNAAIQRWWNEAMKADALPDHIKALSPTEAFEWAGQADFAYVGSGKQGKFLERTHHYIRMQLGMKTKDEQMWETVTRTMSERYLDGVMEPVGKFLRQSAPGAFLRTINFHSMLGFMNPSQLFVQTMGAVAAIALHPIHGVASGKAAPLIRMAMMSDNPEVWAKFAKVNNFMELGFGDTEDFVNTIKGLRKSGLLDGINSTSLYNIEDGAYNVFSNTKRRVGKASLFTFNRGEEMARIISFDVARKEWQAANPGLDFLTDDALRAILIRTDDFTQNMTRANEAFFQRGGLSIPTQFLQYQVKLYANILHAFGTKPGVAHRGFSRKEAAKIAAGHIVLFGIANNGMGSIVEEFLGEKADQAGMSEDQRFYLSQGVLAGLVDSLAQVATGEELKTSLGTRLSTFDWYLTFAEGLTENNFIEVAAGPTYSWVRTGDKVGQVLNMWVQDPNLSFGQVLDGLSQVGESQISTWRNATKAYVANMHEGKLQSAKGDDITTLTRGELLFQALGIAPVETFEMSKLNKRMSDRYNTLRDLTNTIAIQQQRAITAYLNDDKELGDQLSLSAITLLPTNAGDRDFVLRNLRKEHMQNKGYNETVAKYLMKRPDIATPFLTESLTGEE